MFQKKSMVLTQKNKVFTQKFYWNLFIYTSLNLSKLQVLPPINIVLPLKFTVLPQKIKVLIQKNKVFPQKF